jgi:precorrin-6A/cobalt-precorrin-6A reductase
MSTTRLLILGGTGEAAALARAVLARFGDAIEVTTALAGRTRHPGPIAGQVRIGGFGGVAGLADYLLTQRVDRVIDATHPFAAEISSAARLACDQTRIPRLLLVRPAWRRHPLDRWIEVDSVEAAAQIVGRVGHRALLTLGAGEVAAFAPANGVRFLVRTIDPPRAPLPLRFYEVVLGRGPFALTEERHLLQRHATEAKLVAARELSLPVIMVRRPPVERGLSVDTVDGALDWLAGLDERPEARRMS